MGLSKWDPFDQIFQASAGPTAAMRIANMPASPHNPALTTSALSCVQSGGALGVTGWPVAAATSRGRSRQATASTAANSCNHFCLHAGVLPWAALTTCAVHLSSGGVLDVAGWPVVAAAFGWGSRQAKASHDASSGIGRPGWPAGSGAAASIRELPGHASPLEHHSGHRRPFWLCWRCPGAA